MDKIKARAEGLATEYIEAFRDIPTPEYTREFVEQRIRVAFELAYRRGFLECNLQHLKERLNAD